MQAASSPWAGIRNPQHFRRIQPVLAAGRLPLGPKSGPEVVRSYLQFWPQYRDLSLPTNCMRLVGWILCHLRKRAADWSRYQLPTWQYGLMRCSRRWKKSGSLNKTAACWTGVSVALTGLSVLLGARCPPVQRVRIGAEPLASDQKSATEIGALPSNDRYDANCARSLRSS